MSAGPRTSSKVLRIAGAALLFGVLRCSESPVTEPAPSTAGTWSSSGAAGAAPGGAASGGSGPLAGAANVNRAGGGGVASPVAGSASSFGGEGPSGAGGHAGASDGQGGSGLPVGGTGGTGTAGAPTGSGGTRPTIKAEAGTTLVKVDPENRHQPFEGWGTSLCWWANQIGGWSESARNAVVDAIVNPVSGLGYNVFRYNIGGGENPAHEHMGKHREMSGFAPSSGTYDWDADANQRAILLRIAETGEHPIFEAFSNSPPHWMTKSGCASGSSDGSNNLKDDSYEAFADYLTEVVKHYKETYGVTFRTLEPLNEPNANWWKSMGSQEGCHFSPSNQQQIIQEVAKKLTAKGLSGTSVSASDENSMDDAYNNMRAFSATTFSAISQMNTHSYAGSRRKELQALAKEKGKRLWQSESGPLSQNLSGEAEAALFMAGRIIQDLRELQPEAWVDWQVIDPALSWTSFKLNEAQEAFTPVKRFYMHAGFSRFIRPGATFVEIDNADMVAAVSADGHALSLVVRNGNTSGTKRFTFDLTRLPSVGPAADVYRTSRDEDLVKLPAIPIENYRLLLDAPAFSVTTLVVPMP